MTVGNLNQLSKEWNYKTCIKVTGCMCECVFVANSSTDMALHNSEASYRIFRRVSCILGVRFSKLTEEIAPGIYM